MPWQWRPSSQALDEHTLDKSALDKPALDQGKVFARR